MRLLKPLFVLRGVLCQAPAYLFYFFVWWVYPQRTLRHKAAVSPHPRVQRLLLKRTGVVIGRQVSIGFGSILLGRSRTPPAITLGDRVALGPYVVILASSFPEDSLLCKHPDVQSMIHKNAPVVVQEDAWIGAGVVILPGITIGRRAIVGAGAVVTKDVPPFTVVAGVPARVIKTLSGAPGAPPSETGQA